MRLNSNKKITAWLKCPLPGAEGEEYLLVWTPYEKAKRQLAENAMTIDELLLSWKGVEDQEGNPIPCTPENRELFIEDPEGQERLAWMFLAAANYTNFFDVEKFLKNLPAPLSGALIIQKQQNAVA